MDIDDLTQHEKICNLKEELLAVETARMAGEKGYAIDELDDYLNGIINETSL